MRNIASNAAETAQDYETKHDHHCEVVRKRSTCAAKIREQIKVGVWPVRLKPEDWASGEINWLFDVIAPDRKITGQVIANFKQVIKEGDLRLHPLVAKLVEPEILEKLGATKTAPATDTVQ